MSALGAMTRMETKLFFREPVLPLLVLALPVLLLVGFGLIPGFGDPSADLGGQGGTEYIASLGVGIVLAILGLSVLPTTIATYRERGVLRRLRATPIRPQLLLGAQLILVGAAAVVAVLLLVGVGAAAFGVAVPRNLPGFVLAVVLGAAALLSIGMLVAAVAPTARAASAIGTVSFFPSAFLAGIYVPRDSFSPLLKHISDVTPLGAALESVRDTWQGAWPHPVHLVTMVAWALVAGVVAARTFRWE
ncbi:MAG TPA: ABC transporter permease [Mycobacteriales bacterium]|nr:ABC transporter permease [Mycobacteriales bacterium]